MVQIVVRCRSKLQLRGCIATVPFERRTGKLATFVDPETIQANTGRNHKVLVEQLERIDSLLIFLEEKDLIPRCVLVNKLCDVVVGRDRGPIVSTVTSWNARCTSYVA